MKKYVFYLETAAPVLGSQTLLLELAAYLADNTDNDVYYVNNYFNQDLMRITSERLHFETAQSFDFSVSDDAVFFTPVNYLMHLLVRIKDYPNAKVCLYQYDPQAVNWLCNHVGNNNLKNELTELFDATCARAFLNYNCVTPQDSLHRYENRSFLPLVSTAEASDLISEKLISEDTINIAYYGNLNAQSYTTIYNIFHNLAVMRTSRNINIHIIGKATISLNAAFKQCSENLTRVIFTDALEREDCENYIRKNVDIVFATNSNAVEAASFGAPVVVPVTDGKPFAGNNYVYLFDINGYVYSFNNSVLLTLDNTCHKLEHIIDDVYSDGKKGALAGKCYEYALQNNSLKGVAQKFAEFEQKCEFYVRDCLCVSDIAECLDKFDAFNEGDLSFSDYLDSLKVKTPEQPAQAERKKKILDFLASSAKKLVNENAKFYKVQRHYAEVERNLRKKFKKTGKLKVAFLVVFNSVFPTRPIFERMLKDNVFDPTVIVVPNVSRTMKYQVDTCLEAYDALSAQYPGRVILGYDFKTDTYLDLKEDYNILFFCNPYKHLVHPKHHIENFIDKNVLTVYSSYGFAALKFWDEVIATDFYNYLWKAYVETQSNLKHLESVQKIKGVNGFVTGYIKVDKLAEVEPTPRERKRILICPHHTVWGWKNLNISNFLKYSELFVRLPKLFPDIDFVFRPHPLLIVNLKEHRVWTQQQIDAYFERLLANPNMSYDTSGDYFQQFADSDAMIHDCGSFIGEYLYTEKPCCYMLKSEEETYKGLVPLGQQCMDQYYHAFKEEDIIKFIQNLVNTLILINYNISKLFIII